MHIHWNCKGLFKQMQLSSQKISWLCTDVHFDCFHWTYLLFSFLTGDKVFGFGSEASYQTIFWEVRRNLRTESLR